MNLNTWLDSEAGRATKLAAHFGRTRSAITQWRTNGVPVHLMLGVREFTNGDVTLEEMIGAVTTASPEQERQVA